MCSLVKRNMSIALGCTGGVLFRYEATRPQELLVLFLFLFLIFLICFHIFIWRSSIFFAFIFGIHVRVCLRLKEDFLCPAVSLCLVPLIQALSPSLEQALVVSILAAPNPQSTGAADTAAPSLSHGCWGSHSSPHA